jgi:hypothetical protein
VKWTKLSARLALLRQHPIPGLEILSGISDELPVAWMIHGFHTHNNLHQPGIMLADVLDELGLALAGPVTRTAPASAID